MAVVSLSVRPSVCPVPDPKSKMEWPGKLNVAKRKAMTPMNYDPIYRSKCQRSLGCSRWLLKSPLAYIVATALQAAQLFRTFNKRTISRERIAIENIWLNAIHQTASHLKAPHVVTQKPAVTFRMPLLNRHFALLDATPGIWLSHARRMRDDPRERNSDMMHCNRRRWSADLSRSPRNPHLYINNRLAGKLVRRRRG